MLRKFIALFTCVPLLLLTNTVYSEDVHKDDELESIYYIMIDRFNNGTGSNDYEVNVKDMNAYFGGDFQGIIDKLDYIKEMGFTTINLSPIFNNDINGYDGNSIIDFNETEEHFGTKKELQNLIKKAHDKHLKVIIDINFLYTSSHHPWLNDPSKVGWYLDRNDKRPRLNLENEEVQQYFIDTATRWIKDTDIDGFRFVQLEDIPLSFLRNFIPNVQKVKSHLILLGETSESKEGNQWRELGIEYVADYTLTQSFIETFSQYDQPFHNINQYVLDKSEQQQPFIKMLDNEATERFTFHMVNKNMNPGTRWKLALTYVYTTPGQIFMTYGSEIALNGEKPPTNHQFMNFRTDQELVDYVKRLAKLRNENEPLLHGDFEVLYDDDHATIFKRTFDNQTNVVVINNSSETLNVSIDEQEIGESQELKGLLNGHLIREKDGKYTFIIDREESEIFLLKEKSGINLTYIFVIVGINTLFLLFMYVVWKKGRKDRAS